MLKTKNEISLSKGIKLLVFLSLVVHLLTFLFSSFKGSQVFMAQTIAHENGFQMATDSNSSSQISFNFTKSSPLANASAPLTELLRTDRNHTDSEPPTATATIPLAELVNTDPNPVCKPGKSNKTLIESLILDESITHPPNLKIPKIIHFTSRTRCMTPHFIKNINKWKFDNYSMFIHDDAAVDRLLQKYWPEFPHLQLLQKCMISGAAKADLWRYLVLWEYGGIYTDIDNAPGPKFENATFITDGTDSWFVVEKLGIMSQYVMAATPKHPFMHIAVMHCLARLLDVASVGTQYVPYVTGPGVIKSAMIYFMRSESDQKAYQKVSAGHYIGVGNRSVTVVGSRGDSNVWIQRESVAGIHKIGGYAAMGMKHFSKVKNKELKISCYEHLYNEEAKEKSG